MSKPRTRQREDIDWTGVRRRLDAMERALQAGEALAPDAAARVLDARAAQLARPVADGSADEATLSLVTFALGNETYGIEGASVRGVFRLTDLAPLPGASASVAGVTLWRGELLVVLDLRQVLGLGVTGLDDRAWVVTIGNEHRSRGLLAGALREAAAVPQRDVSPPEREERGAGTPYVRGVTTDATQLLDAAALLELDS